MTPQVLEFIPVSLGDIGIYIEVSAGHHVTKKPKGEVKIKMCDDNKETFIATLHNVLSAPNICNRLFSVITLMNLVHNCLFQKRFFVV